MASLKLSASQQRALDKISGGDNVCVTGSGGTGKSALIREVERLFQSRGQRVALTALTGVASVQIGGRTLHSFLCGGLMEEPVEELVKKAQKLKHIGFQMRKLRCLVIDEVSMMSPDLFEKTDRMLRAYRGRWTVPFGGLQVVLVGDFFQIPPVEKESEAPGTGHSAGDSADDLSSGVAASVPPARFVFETRLFREVLGGDDRWRESVIELREVFRQPDPHFVSLLNRAREGALTEEDVAVLQSRVGADLPKARELGIRPTVLVSHRSRADAINHKELAELLKSNPSVRYEATASAVAEPGVHGPKSLELLQRELGKMQREMQAPKVLTLCVGAQVMIIKNLKTALGLVPNGTRGVVVDFQTVEGMQATCPVVRTAEQDLLIEPQSWERRVPFVGSCHVKTLPLQYGWAMTQHKSQGQTLDFVDASLDSSVFAPGMAYVALSRVRTLEGLTLRKFVPEVVRCDDRVLAFFRELRSPPTTRPTEDAGRSTSPQGEQLLQAQRRQQRSKQPRDSAGQKTLADAFALAKRPTLTGSSPGLAVAPTL